MRTIIYKILWTTIEDFVGLWEIDWELNSLLPHNDATQNKDISKKILLFFLEAELVVFYFNNWGNDELKEIKFNDAVELINKENFWNAPSLNEPCIKIGNTKKGEEYYNKELISDYEFKIRGW